MSASSLHDLETPRVVVDLDRLERNLKRVQERCNRHGVELWPHIKTHKMVQVARRQLELGARGLTCAKIGEAEAMLPSGVRRIFIAHSIVDPRSAQRLASLASQLDELVLAVTSAEQARALETVLASVDLTVSIMQAVDTGLGREGSRSIEEAKATADVIRAQPHMKLRGFYTHEGHTYGATPEDQAAAFEAIYQKINAVREAIDPSLAIWPGCSVSAMVMATKPNVQAVRPGAYCFGDLALCHHARVLGWEDAAVTILTTVVDRPEPGLALIDAGSKTFSGDKSRAGISGLELCNAKLEVVKCNEEHGYVKGEGVDDLKIGDRLRIVPAHICPVLNLADEVIVVRGETIVDIWPVEGRGKNR